MERFKGIKRAWKLYRCFQFIESWIKKIVAFKLIYLRIIKNVFFSWKSKFGVLILGLGKFDGACCINTKLKLNFSSLTFKVFLKFPRNILKYWKGIPMNFNYFSRNFSHLQLVIINFTMSQKSAPKWDIFFCKLPPMKKDFRAFLNHFNDVSCASYTAQHVLWHHNKKSCFVSFLLPLFSCCCRKKFDMQAVRDEKRCKFKEKWCKSVKKLRTRLKKILRTKLNNVSD